MKAVFIEPPQENAGNITRFYGAFGTSKVDFVWPPLELMGIAGYLNKFKVETKILDAGGLKKNFDDVKKYIEQEKPDLVVFSTSTTTIYSDILVAKMAKEVSQDIVTAAVGTHVMALPKETIKLSNDLDVAVYSDDEEIIVKNLLFSQKDFSKVKGIAYRDKNGVIIKNAGQESIDNLDELGFPAHDQVPKEIYYDFMTRKGPLALVMAQRGCINRCMYCICPVLYKYRERTVGHVIEELKWLKSLGYKEFKFINAGLTYNLNWVNNLLDRMIEEKLDLSWWANARADRLNPELLRKIKKAGCHTLAIGMESANRQILKTVGKNVLPEQVKKTALDIRKAGMKTAVYFIFGLPGETKETIRETIDFAKSLPVDFVTMGVAQPLPGTKFYDYLKEKNFLITDNWNKYDPVKAPVYKYPDLTSEEILEATKTGYKEFYIRPSYILRRVFCTRSFSDLKSNLSGFLSLIRRYF